MERELDLAGSPSWRMEAAVADKRTRAGAPGTSSSEKLTELRRSEEHTSELQSPCNFVCRLLLVKKNSNCCFRGSTSVLIDSWRFSRSPLAVSCNLPTVSVIRSINCGCTCLKVSILRTLN